MRCPARERGRATRAFHQSDEASDEREQHQDAGVVRVGELNHEVVADQARGGGYRIAALECQHAYIDTEEKR